ncbi:MAG TPA: 4-hydroxy-tetrahydrodipicolinate reductase, partial [Chthonomonadales bacterium]|nr:4-hydroxy-tetrahydrodipicolinate reductase [Chthonomonadales bacterium]
AMTNGRTAIECGVSPVIGTTGISEAERSDLHRLAANRQIGAFLAPNFAIGAVLMMEFAARASALMPSVEIIELHHENKVDAPSGTALLTAERISAAQLAAGMAQGATEAPPGSGEAQRSRGEVRGGIHIHSVRLPGLLAHQEVILGAEGQTLSLRHDSTDRRCFMPGVILAARKVRSLRGLVVGLENLL